MILLDLSLSQLTEEIKKLNLPAFRAKQIYANLQKYKAFDEMTDLPENLRQQLAALFIAQPLTIEKQQTSRDGTIKFLFKCNDGEYIESVLLSQSYGKTLCISSQVGCKMNCSFCASGKGGFVRNLTAGEIIAQYLLANRGLAEENDKFDRYISNIVMMGVGEPLDNFDNVISFLKLITSEDGMNISARNISLSTCGIVPKILRFAEQSIPANLCLSLHSPFDEERQKLMPIAKTYSVKQSIDAMQTYFEKSGRRFYVEYAVMKGTNDTDAAAKELAKLLRGKTCHINLIPLNEIEEFEKHTTRKDAENFQQKLEKLGLSATVRNTFGTDIDAACGQLRRKFGGCKDE